MSDEVLTERRERVLVITLNRPDQMNSINTALAKGLVAAIEELDGDPGLSLGVLTGAGRGFSAGMDLKAFAKEGTPQGFQTYIEKGSQKPMIAAIEGFCDRIDLVGYSMGAHVSLGVATEETRVRSVVLGGIGGATVTGAAFDRSEIADGLIVEDASTITNARAKGFRRFAEATKADRFALAAVMRADGVRPTGLDRIAVPCMVLVGTEDDLAANVHDLLDAIPGAKLVTVPGDHLSAVAEPAFAEALVDFLAGVEAGAST